MLKVCTKANSNSIIYTIVKDDGVKNRLIMPKVKHFFASNNIREYSELDVSLIFSDIDYINQEISMSYVYENLLSEIYRDTDGAIKFPIKYIITIDKINCPQKCRHTGMNYDSIELNDTPFLYFLHIDIDEMIKFIRSAR